MFRNTRIGMLILIIVVSLSLPASVAVTRVAAAQTAAVNPISIVTLTNDNAGVRRLGWAAFSKLVLGQQVAFGDLIDPKGKLVRVLCSNLVEMAVTQLGPIPCPKDRTILVQDDQQLAGWQRSKPADVTIPFLISPRGSTVATANPTIWWNTVDDADSYRVTVRGDGLDWHKDISDPKVGKLVYPTDAPALKPGQNYTVEISAIAGGTAVHSSAEEDVPGLSFKVIEPDKLAPIQKSISTIKSNVSDKNIANLTMALYYAQNGLDADAVQLLVGITGDPLVAASAPTNAQLGTSPAVYLALGDLFMQSHSEIYASASYSRALDLATQSGDLQSQAMAQVGLARLATDTDKQKEYATAALKLWQQLGAKDQVDSVTKEFSIDAS